MERSFAWLNRYRRLSRDYKKLARSAEVFIQMVFCDLILAKIMNWKIKTYDKRFCFFTKFYLFDLKKLNV